MADLDDFFAKKDRKKSKGGKKFTTTEELAKKLEETHRKEKEKLKEKKTLTSQNVDGEGELGGERQDEDEWKEFVEEKKDYTNLKIQNLQINETASADDAEGEDGEPIMEENEAGEMVPRKRQPTGPWMNSQQQQQQQHQQQQQQQQQQQEAVREEVRPQPPPPSAGGGEGAGGNTGSGYVPPHLRGASSASSHSYTPSPSASGYSPYSTSSYSPLSNSRFRSKAAPDITNEAYFPTLSAANNAEPNTAWGRRREEGRGFEEVRNSRTGATRYDPKMAPSGQGPNLSLGNKWDALRDQS